MQLQILPNGVKSAASCVLICQEFYTGHVVAEGFIVQPRFRHFSEPMRLQTQRVRLITSSYVVDRSIFRILDRKLNF